MRYRSCEEWVKRDVNAGWMILSFMAMASSEQERYFKYPLLNTWEKGFSKKSSLNPLIGLIMTFDECINSLGSILDIDIFYQDTEQLKESLYDFKKTDPLFLTRQGFIEGKNWDSIRERARSIRKKIGIGVCRDIPYPLDFHDFVEPVG